MSPRELPRTVVVGRVIRPHGVRGELLVEELTEVPGRFAVGSELLVSGASAAPEQSLRVVAARSHGQLLLVSCNGIEDRSAAERLRGAWLEVPRECVPPAPEGHYYLFELVGCSCSDRRAGSLGTVVDVLEDGGGLLLEVSDDARRLLIPFVSAYLVRADMARGELEFDLPEGLLETCASKS